MLYREAPCALFSYVEAHRMLHPINVQEVES